MGWFFRDNQLQKYKSQYVRAEEYCPGLIDISEIDLLGRCFHSPGRRWLLALQNKPYRSEHNNGRIVLLSENRLLWQREIERPGDGAVADNGNVVICDWMLRSGDEEYDANLKGTFLALNCDGQIITQQLFTANLMACGITADGRFAWCSTAVSSSQDSRIMAVYDLMAEKCLFRTASPYSEITGFIWCHEAFQINTEKQITCLYSLTGELLNEQQVREMVEADRLVNGKVWDVLEIADQRQGRRAIREMTVDETGELIRLLKLASSRLSAYPYQNARTERRLGEIYLAINDRRAALKHFEKALECDPKAGVKKMIVKLKKELS